MTKEELIPYCHYWKGEDKKPARIDTDNAWSLWFAEKEICTNMPRLVKGSNPRKSLDMAVAAYVSKWAPYSFAEILKDYFKYDNTYENEVMHIIA